MISEKHLISEHILFEEIKNQLSAGRMVSFTVTGMSMWPFLCHGRDQVIIKLLGEEKLKKGDIILFQTSDGKYILHRITRIKDNKIQTTGDGNYYHDGWITKECVVAKVDHSIRKGQKILMTDHKWKVLSDLWMRLFFIRKFLISGYLKLKWKK